MRNRGRVDYVVQVEIPPNDPNLKDGRNDPRVQGRDVFLYEDDVLLDRFEHKNGRFTGFSEGEADYLSL